MPHSDRDHFIIKTLNPAPHPTLPPSSVPHSDRDRFIIKTNPSFRCGRHYGAFYIVFIVGLSYAVVSPIMLPLCLGFFMTSWLAWRYTLL